MLTRQFWLAMFVIVLNEITNGFVLERKSPCNKCQSIAAFYDPYEGSSSTGRDASDHNRARMDLRIFLTQRSIQSFVFVLNQCHEEHTVRWLENKLNFKKIDSFHGTGAFNVTIFPEWDSLLLELANQDPETVIIEVKQKRSHRGWGHQASYVNTISNNANIAPRTSHFTAPPHCSRGIAGNYLANLNTKRSSPSTLTPGQKTPKPTSQASGLSGSYLEALSQQHIPNTEVHKRLRPKRKTGRKTRKEREMIHRQTGLEQEKEQTSALSRPRLGVKSGYLETLLSNAIESTFTEPPTERKENPYLEEKSIEYHFNIDPPSLVTRIISVREQISNEWKGDLDTLIRTNDRILDDYKDNQCKSDSLALEDDDTEEEHSSSNHLVSPYRPSQEGKTLIYDRNAMAYLTNSIASQDRASSPFRKSNFDLLLLLCTQESIHRIIREYKEDMEDEMHTEKHKWLHSFYTRNVAQYFDGHEHSFGRADQFLEKLMKQPPVALQTRKGGLYLIDPVTMTEDILRERSMVAREWKSIVVTIPDEHLDLRRILFTRHLMEVTDWKFTRSSSNSLHIEHSPPAETSNELGAFE